MWLSKAWLSCIAEVGTIVRSIVACYENGDIVAVDLAKAREWYAKAAALGDEAAVAQLQEDQEDSDGSATFPDVDSTWKPVEILSSSRRC